MGHFPFSCKVSIGTVQVFRADMFKFDNFLDKETYKQDNKVKFWRATKPFYPPIQCSTDIRNVIFDNCFIRLSCQIFTTKPGKRNEHFELSALRLRFKQVQADKLKQSDHRQENNFLIVSGEFESWDFTPVLLYQELRLGLVSIWSELAIVESSDPERLVRIYHYDSNVWSCKSEPV